jgi:hypothetical protein
MAEQPSVNRPSLRRAAIYAAGFALFLSSYVTSYLGFMWLCGRGSIPRQAEYAVSHTVFALIEGYYAGQYPGADYLWVAERRVFWHGRGYAMPEYEKQAIERILGRPEPAEAISD